VPLALGSDTNGSIRVPASFCGVLGLKPTFGRLSRAGSFPFVSSLDHLGPLARGVGDLAASYDAMQGPDAADPVCTTRAAEPARPLLEGGHSDLRIAVAGGYFRQGASAEALAAVDDVARALGATRAVELPEAAQARASAYVITAAEGAALHLDRLRACATEFDPAVRDRLIAGALMPAGFVVRAQRFRRWFQAETRALFERVDVIVAPATPCVAPVIGQQTLDLDGAEVPLRPNLGLFTQSISFVGLPVVLLCGPASGRRAGAARRLADRRAVDRRALAGGARAARGARARGVRRHPRAATAGASVIEVNLPDVRAEVEAAFARYEAALVGNDVATLTALFWDDPRTIRYGTAENLYGAAEIAAFRQARSPAGLGRRLSRTVITTFGRDLATTSTLFHRDTLPGRVGRQTQTWVRLPEIGWRVVAAHVSVIAAPSPA
jgi:1-carboxybiuret hydrolase